MIRYIAQKEILETMLSLRFGLAVILSVLLFSVSSLVFITDYQRQTNEYREQMNHSRKEMLDRSDHLYELALYKQTVYRKPKPLSFCSTGATRAIPNAYRFNIFSREIPEKKSRPDTILMKAYEVDWVFIISVVMSFVALTFTFDRICGEKEKGVLRLIMSGPIPRYTVILGKYCGAMVAVSVPIGVGVLTSLIIVSGAKSVHFTSEDWQKISILFFMMLLYGSIFIHLGLLISARMVRSDSSMVVLLFLWVGLVILVPYLGRTVAEIVRPIPTRAMVLKKQAAIDTLTLDNAIAGKYGPNAASWGPSLSQGKYNPAARRRYFNDGNEKRNQLLDDYITQMRGQFNFACQFSRLSPTGAFRQACARLVGSGAVHFTDMYYQVRNYQDRLRKRIQEVDAKDPDSLHLLYEDRDTAYHWKTMSHKPIALEHIPIFREQSLAVGKALGHAIYDIGLLCVLNIVLFCGVFIAFVRCDLR